MKFEKMQVQKSAIVRLVSQLKVVRLGVTRIVLP